MFYLSAYLETNRDVYYQRLNGIITENDWKGWINFFLIAVVDQAGINCEKAREIVSSYYRMKKEVIVSIHSQFSIQTLDTLWPYLRLYIACHELSAMSHIVPLSAVDHPKSAKLPNTGQSLP